jgi:hypothetical protein
MEDDYHQADAHPVASGEFMDRLRRMTAEELAELAKELARRRAAKEVVVQKALQCRNGGNLIDF